MCVCVCVCIPACVYMCVRMRVSMCVCVYLCVCIYVSQREREREREIEWEIERERVSEIFFPLNQREVVWNGRFYLEVREYIKNRNINKSLMKSVGVMKAKSNIRKVIDFSSSSSSSSSSSCEFFTPALADGLSMEFEWQQISSSLQDSSQYFGRPQQCCGLDGLGSSSIV